MGWKHAAQGRQGPKCPEADSINEHLLSDENKIRYDGWMDFW